MRCDLRDVLIALYNVAELFDAGAIHDVLAELLPEACRAMWASKLHQACARRCVPPDPGVRGLPCARCRTLIFLLTRELAVLLIAKSTLADDASGAGCGGPL